MAFAGSAIGLGNIWRFPYMVGQNGGAAFIIVYILCCIVIALPIFLSESVIGRRSRANTYGAMERLAPGTPWKWLGVLTVVAPIVILSYYSVVGGWAVEYLFDAVTLRFSALPAEEVPELFGSFISSPWQPVVMHTIFLAMVAGIILGGVKSGIELFSKLTMPVLFVLIVVLVVYSLSLPGSREGVDYLLRPDWSRLSVRGVTAAMGQAFFSMSLGIGTILTYASYVDRREKLLLSGAGTALSDLLFALLSGFAIMPAVFAAGIAPGAGPGLLFETLPFIFNKMGAAQPWIGAAVAIVFFVTILVAALTSAISLMEVGVAYLVEEKRLSRTRATLLLFGVAWAIGLLCSLSFGPLSGVQLLGNGIFDLMDKCCSNFLMPLGGLLLTLFAGWKMSRADVEDELCGGRGKWWFGPLYFLIRWVAPAGIIIIFITNLVF